MVNRWQVLAGSKQTDLAGAGGGGIRSAARGAPAAREDADEHRPGAPFEMLEEYADTDNDTDRDVCDPPERVVEGGGHDWTRVFPVAHFDCPWMLDACAHPKPKALCAAQQARQDALLAVAAAALAEERAGGSEADGPRD